MSGNEEDFAPLAIIMGIKTLCGKDITQNGANDPCQHRVSHVM
ncbi:hypothetical protein SAMN04488689_10635 [Paenibacillus sp. cl6col]|nr:hypothetical protein SAMN04488689_10635 [Paenibacillus sp. cl6col]